jgi:hypothetical protein
MWLAMSISGRLSAQTGRDLVPPWSVIRRLTDGRYLVRRGRRGDRKFTRPAWAVTPRWGDRQQSFIFLKERGRAKLRAMKGPRSVKAGDHRRSIAITARS